MLGHQGRETQPIQWRQAMSSSVEQVYEDQWGAIIDRPEFVEIRWYDTTRGMTWEDFQKFLTKFAEACERGRRLGALVDATSFLMDMNLMENDWRDAHIIPRYNGAGIRKFAFHMPAGMPAIGAPPAPEGPANFPTAYFGTREDALEWLKS